uniref:Uncharacterized protein n=1 Tax=Rhizophora mucronata TaxID=61149 RepID=A0A2P2KZN9_RHIMU
MIQYIFLPPIFLLFKISFLHEIFNNYRNMHIETMGQQLELLQHQWIRKQAKIWHSTQNVKKSKSK